MQNLNRRTFVKTAIAGAAASSPFFVFAENGVTSSSIKVGSVHDLTGNNKSTGIAVSEGAKAYINAVNTSGGVNGRKIELITYDDNYEPTKTLEMVKKLVEQDKVMALTNFVGTNTTQVALPYMLKEAIPFIGAGTGAEFLRAPLKRTVFSVRSSYYKEVDAVVERLTKDLGMKSIAVLNQNDSFGDAGRIGLERAMARRGMKPSAVAAYDKNTPNNVDEPYAIIKAAKPDAVILAAISGPAIAFMKKAYQEKLGSKLVGISSMRTRFLKDMKPEEYEGFHMCNILPEPQTSSLAICASFKTDMAKSGFKDVTSAALEGYVNAIVLIEGLRGAGSDPTRASLINSLEGLNKDIGGVKFKYSETDHEAISELFFSKAVDGKLLSVSSFK